MAGKGQTGYCYICGAELDQAAMKDHLLEQHNAGEEKCCLLKVEGRHMPDYWLYLDMPVTARLYKLERFLKRIWLESGSGYTSDFYNYVGDPYPKSAQLQEFKSGWKLLYEYDRRDSTLLSITLVKRTRRAPGKDAVRLLARNRPLDFTCGRCGAPAVYIDHGCLYEGEDPFFCEACLEKNGADMPVRIANSPRLGHCFYNGEQDVYGFDPEAIGRNEKEHIV